MLGTPGSDAKVANCSDNRCRCAKQIRRHSTEVMLAMRCMSAMHDVSSLRRVFNATNGNDATAK